LQQKNILNFFGKYISGRAPTGVNEDIPAVKYFGQLFDQLGNTMGKL